MAARRETLVTLAGLVLVGTLAGSTAPVAAAPRQTSKQPVATGYLGAVATVDPEATRAGVEVLRRGGNAVDAAVAAAAVLGVTEPYSAGIGGGGFFVYYDARTGRVHTIDGRETAPQRMREDSFIDPATGQPMKFEDAVSSGLSVGVPGTPLTWDRALRRWGTTSLAQALRPAIRIAERGFVVDETFRQQTAENEKRFREFTSTRELFLPGGEPPRVGSVFRNPDLAATYREIARHGVGVLYRGELGRDIVRTVQHPPVAPGVTRKVAPGLLETSDLARYTAPLREPTHVTYRGLDVYGMAPPSSGGSTVGEALNILERYDLSAMSRTQALHHYLEASRLAFADRNRWVGDPDFVKVPLQELLSQGFAAERACLIRPDRALQSPIAPGEPDGRYAGCPAAGTGAREPYEGRSTTHLTVADRWGNVVAYALTIEQTGGSGIVVPGRGFLLNNELTDFNFVPLQAGVPDPNLPGPGKRPRSSMSPTIVLRDGRPLLAVGSPGGATIITTVLQILVSRLDLGMSLPEAVAAPRASQRNGASTEAEPAFETGGLTALGHRFQQREEIGAATGIEFLTGHRMTAVAEPTRRGGGSAMVVAPKR
ncbi:Gamma-glutamyltransferase [Carbonactinospora thermoautotrophica]|uniref:Glutathione hydrolase proenzyme n=1 Tax=Carbonactinospora thermoautotrophica TaxID=1469144 RepID=A0A132MPJ4_9ACTN|nr:gamma-glutamyltransferase [Carbonactinospora thermoautotrophica]KWW99762.1 Gamma-glutamyltransferase [Carbonactinospora thermoautotrophica]